MKKIIILWMTGLLVLAAQAQCNWSRVYLAYGNTYNSYKFEVAGTVDTCLKTTTIITNKKTLKKDTFYTRAFSKVFTDTGRYNVFVKVYNKCLKCDTAFEKPLYVTCVPCDWSKAGFYFTNKCRTYTFEMGSYINSCVKYTTQRYNLKTKRIDTIYGRVFTTTFGDTGTYKFYVKMVDTCKKCDTTFYKIIKVDCLGTLGNSKYNLEQLIITPNPVKMGFEVNVGGRTEYDIYDVSGKIIQSGLVDESKYVSTELLKNGIYYFKTNRGIQSFIVQK